MNFNQKFRRQIPVSMAYRIRESLRDKKLATRPILRTKALPLTVWKMGYSNH
jgi:hypothetical protein